MSELTKSELIDKRLAIRQALADLAEQEKHLKEQIKGLQGELATIRDEVPPNGDYSELL